MAAYDVAAPRTGRRTPGFSVSGLISGALEWRKNRIAAAELRAMPDHILDDLGLNRADVDTAVHYGRR